MTKKPNKLITYREGCDVKLIWARENKYESNATFVPTALPYESTLFRI